MNIFKHEFNMKKKSILIWSLSLAGFIVFYMAFFPSMAQDSEVFDSIMDNFPKEMLYAFGLRDGLSMSSLIGYFTLTFSMTQLAIAIQSSNYGFAILSEEERELTADFLMSKPVSRKTIYFSKLSAAFLSLLITAIFVGLGSFISLQLFNGGDTYEVSNLLKLLITVPIFQLVFLSLGMFISLLFKKIRSVLSFSMGLSIGLYVINSVKGVFDPGLILKDGEYDIKLLLASLVIIVLSLAASYLIYNKRDINSL